jgi:cation diffusion facilitator family transporter
MSDCGCGGVEGGNAAQRRALRLLLGINAGMFAVEAIVGTIAGSTALVADSLDMLADALVYGISLLAVGGSKPLKIRAARLSGIFQITLGVFVLLDVIRKVLGEHSPESQWMMAIGSLALVANVVCLWLIGKHRRGEVHMRASWIFSRNDVIANLAVIGAGVLVWLFKSSLPDLVVGLAITGLVLRGGVQILQDARREAEGL